MKSAPPQRTPPVPWQKTVRQGRFALLLGALLAAQPVFETPLAAQTEPAPNHSQLALASLASARQSSNSSPVRTAVQAIDGSTSTFSETADQAGSFWELELSRAIRVSQVALTAPSAAGYSGIVNGLVLRVSNLRDQILFETNVTGVALGGTWSAPLPAGIDARIIRFSLDEGMNGAGNHRIALAEVRLFGDPSPALGPVSLGAIASISQSSTASENVASLAIDGNPASFSETLDQIGSHLLVTLDRTRSINRVELINRTGANAARMGGLTVRILDAQSNSVASALTTNPGAGATWTFTPPAGTSGRQIRIGLEGNATNSQGNRIVTMAEVSVFTGENYALGADSYMTRSHDGLQPTSNVNDGDFATAVSTHSGTVDGYFEIDLGETKALYSVRAVAASGMQSNVTNTTVLLYDEAHDTVFSQRLAGSSEVFDVPLPGPVLARYVRVGLENKQRTSPGSNTRVFGLREIQAFGRPSAETGLLSFTASQTSIPAEGSTGLQWQQDGLHELHLYPGIGSVGSHTAPNGAGTLTISPAQSAQYILVGSSYNGATARHLTIEVNGEKLPPRITEFVASNRLSFRDGNGAAPDWIEIHNPNNTPLDLSGYHLSDNPEAPAKWAFPEGAIISAQGYLVVFASDSNDPYDPNGFLHANFNLSAGGESVVLTAPDGVTPVDAILNYPPQREDLSFGRTLDGDWKFLEPTPGAVNIAESYTGWLDPVVFSHERGFYTNGFPLIITNPNPESQLSYSIDGTEPSVPYIGPIVITNVTGVRATARRAGYKSPRVQTHSYIFIEGVISSPVMNTTITGNPTYADRLRQGLRDVPTFSINVPPAAPEPNSERPEREASVEIFLPDGSAPIQVNCGITHYGGAFGLGTGNPYAKKSYQLKFRAEYGARKLEAPLFRGFERGFPTANQFDELNLHAGNHDMSGRGFYLSHRFAADTMLDMGSLNPHGRFVHLYINGAYYGQFDAHERLTASFLSEYLGGPKEDYLTVKGNDNGPSGNFILGVPDPDPPGRAPWEEMRANRNSYVAVKDALDVPNLIDFMLVWNWGNAEAEYRAAGARVPGPGRGFKFWIADADGHLRNQSGVSSALTRNGTANAGPALLFGALFSEGHPEFRMLLADRIQKHFFNGGAMTPEALLLRMNQRMDEITNSLVAETARWGSLVNRTPANWESDAEYARNNFLPFRSANLMAHMRSRGWYPSIDAPQLSQHGGTITNGFPLSISSGGGTVYYTLDGSDPRLPGGAISPTAQVWAGNTELLIPLQSTWRYFNTNAAPSGAWQNLSYNDSSWQSGPGAFGYGDPYPTATILSFGPSSSDKYRAYYFRKTFNIPDPSAVQSLALGLVRDDGAVVYLNGTEMFRDNMPTGTITYNTLALQAVGGSNETNVFPFTLSPAALVPGVNVIAVEIHQNSITSTDLRFDLTLSAISSVQLTLDSNTVIKTRSYENGQWSALTEAAFEMDASGPYPLSAGPYLMNQWNEDQPAGTYPPHMRFEQTASPDPGLETEMDSLWTLPYHLATRSRINGLGEEGFAFINTGNAQNIEGAGFLGAAVLSLNTLGQEAIRVTWTGGTVTPNDRTYGIRLQYRVGTEGPFLDVPGEGGPPVEYLRNPTAGHAQVVGPAVLPAEANNQPIIELRWKYYHASGNSGARAQLRIDDIQVRTGHPEPQQLAFFDVPFGGQTDEPLLPVTVHARSEAGELATAYDGMVHISAVGDPGLLSGTLSQPAVGGVAVFHGLVFSEFGPQRLAASAEGLQNATSAPIAVVELTEIVMPLFIQGESPENNNRVPFAFRLGLAGLQPGATYRYGNRAVTHTDSPTQDGAGNMIFVKTNSAPFVRSTDSPRFRAADMDARHGEFAADSQGRYTGWFITEPSGNARFATGSPVRMRLLLNDGDGGEETAHFLTAPSEVSVMTFGSGIGDGSALHGVSSATPRGFLVFYEDASGTGRPLAATVVESMGLALDARYAEFYLDTVAGQPGRWGTLIRNNLPSGLGRIEERDLVTGELISSFQSPGGILPTSGMNSGLEPVGIRVPAPGDTGFSIWQSRQFNLQELENTSISGPSADPSEDGTANLLRYALGLDLSDPVEDSLPSAQLQETGDTRHLRFRHRRLIGETAVEYRVVVSNDLIEWTDATSQLIQAGEPEPVGDGLTEIVTFLLPVQEAQQYLRLRVRLQ